MSENMNQLMAYLERENLKVAHQEGEQVLLRFDSDHGDQKLILLIEEDLLIQSFVYPAIKIPEGSRRDIAMAVTRANYGLKIGKFELDMDDGELRFQIAIPFEGDLPSDKVLDQFVYMGLQMMKRYTPAFLSIVYGNEPVKDAIDLVEKM